MQRERKHIRLRNFDYSSEGAYFITVCTKDRENYFGEIKNDEMILNEMGKTADEYLNEILNHFSHAEMDEFIVMPNHVHCILVLNKQPNVGTSHGMSLRGDTVDIVGTRHGVSLHGITQQPEPQFNQFGKPVVGSVSVIINQFKSSLKRWCNKGNHNYFEWQSRFHDHIIRNEEEYNRIKNYIISNPENWVNDKFYK